MPIIKRINQPANIIAEDDDRHVYRLPALPPKPVIPAQTADPDRFHEDERKSYHEFPCAIATEFGVSEAIVLKFLSYRIKKSPQRRDGKAWIFPTLHDISNRIPYIKKTTLSALMKRMKIAKLIEIGNFNRWKHDRTQWYHVPEEYVEACDKGKLIKFNKHVAEELGVPAAVLYYNLTHWIRSQAEADQPKALAQMMSPSGLHDFLPFFSLNTVKRALDRLTEASLIVKTSLTRPLYTLPQNHPIMVQAIDKEDF